MNRNEFISEVKENFLIQLNLLSEFKENSLPFSVYYISGDLIITTRREGITYKQPELIPSITISIKSFSYNKFSFEIKANNIHITPISSQKNPSNQTAVDLYNLFVLLSNTVFSFQNKTDFYNKITELCIKYNESLISNIENAILNIKQQFKNKKNQIQEPRAYVFENRKNSCHDQDRVGKDTKTTTTIETWYTLIPNRIENIYDEKWLKVTEDFLNRNKGFKSSTSFSYSPAEEDSDSENSFLNLGLSRYLNGLGLGNFEYKHLDHKNYKDVKRKNVDFLVFLLFCNYKEIKDLNFIHLDNLFLLCEFTKIPHFLRAQLIDNFCFNEHLLNHDPFNIFPKSINIYEAIYTKLPQEKYDKLINDFLIMFNYDYHDDYYLIDKLYIYFNEYFEEHSK
jgi:hypothetical protein